MDHSKPRLKLNNKTRVTIFFVLIVAVVLIPIIVAIVSDITRERPVLKITNLDAISTRLPSSEWETLEIYIQRYIQEVNNADISKPILAEIRPDSYLEKSNDDSDIEVDFIIDIDELKVTYKVYHAYTTDKGKLVGDTIINCPAYSQLKYQEQECEGMFGSTAKNIELYLPYEGKIKSGEPFYVSYKYYTNGEPYIEVAINSCGDKKILDQALELTKEYLQSNSVNPDDFIFEVPSRFCPGGAE